MKKWDSEFPFSDAWKLAENLESSFKNPISVKPLLITVFRGRHSFLIIMEKWPIFFKVGMCGFGKGFWDILNKILADRKKAL